MENRRITRQKKHKFLCVLDAIDFDETETKHIKYWLVESEQPDCGLASYEVKENIKRINSHINNKYLISVQGYYTGEKKVCSIRNEDLTLAFIQQKLKGVN